jgi:hypothetical protein
MPNTLTERGGSRLPGKNSQLRSTGKICQRTSTVLPAIFVIFEPNNVQNASLPSGRRRFQIQRDCYMHSRPMKPFTILIALQTNSDADAQSQCRLHSSTAKRSSWHIRCLPLAPSNAEDIPEYGMSVYSKKCEASLLIRSGLASMYRANFCRKTSLTRPQKTQDILQNDFERV